MMAQGFREKNIDSLWFRLQQRSVILHIGIVVLIATVDGQNPA